MTPLEIRWPDDGAERVRAARGRLERSGEALRALAIEERIRSIADVIEAWTVPDSPWRRELATRLAEETPFHEATVREGLESALRAWKADELVTCIRRELSSALGSDKITLLPFAWTAVLAGGAVPMPTMLGALLPLVLGSPVLLRESSSDHVTASLLKRSLVTRNATLGDALEPIAFATENKAFDLVLEAPCVVATGSDETIRSISARLRPNQRFVAYGHRFSIGVVGPALESEKLGQVAAGFALDVARWDQTGCLSPVIVCLVGCDPAVGRALANAIASELEKLSARMPRGKITPAVAASQANERAEARMRQVSGGTLCFEADEYTVILEQDARPRPAPLFRFLRLMPVDSLEALERALEPYGDHLSNVATAGFPARALGDLQRRLARFGVSRFTGPGRLQTPPIDWPHDGMPLLIPMARFSQSD